MKAYICGLYSDPDQGNEIVWAMNSREAMREAQCLDCTDEKENYVDVYAKRYPEFDDMENSTKYKTMKKKWWLCWWFGLINVPNPYEDTDEEFKAWYDKYFEVKE